MIPIPGSSWRHVLPRLRTLTKGSPHKPLSSPGDIIHVDYVVERPHRASSSLCITRPRELSSRPDPILFLTLGEPMLALVNSHPYGGYPPRWDPTLHSSLYHSSRPKISDCHYNYPFTSTTAISVTLFLSLFVKLIQA